MTRPPRRHTPNYVRIADLEHEHLSGPYWHGAECARCSQRPLALPPPPSPSWETR